MFSHITIGVSRFDKAFGFYSAALAPLGLTLAFVEHDGGVAGWLAPGADRPMFLICNPLNEAAATAGNGQMTAFQADTRSQVDGVYAAAMAEGAVSEGEPGLRPHYHEHYYGAYFRDPDGNKICVCCHNAEA